GLCLGGLWTISPADEDPSVRRRAVDFIRASAGYSREVDCGVILVPITPGRGSSPEAQREHWIKALRDAAPEAEAAQVVLAIENVGSGCAQSAAVLLDIVNAVGSPFVQIYYDPGNGLSLGQDPVAELHLLGKTIRQLHAKDPGGTLLGQGRLPFPEVVAAVREIGYDGYVVLETDATDDPVHAATENLHFLKEAFA
ncbi:MAG: sugar phosphate isomerase/epimerase, partial [Chloroflexi bacterium]|nr:sugar phosphate isomerase/epimerase [Chloroflexota bacterium]